jgi:hypothetical protein
MHDSMKSLVAIFSGFMLVVLLSVATDSLFFSRTVEAVPDGRLAIALAYRCLYAIAGAYVAAQMAPSRPVLHAFILGAIGMTLAIAGAIIMWDRGQNWYPVALVVTALPCAWLGGRLQVEVDRRMQ